MDDFVPPAFGIGFGRGMATEELLVDFVSGGTEGQSPSLRIEGDVLITTAGAIAALRIGERALLVRAAGELADPDANITTHLLAADLRCVVRDPALADVVALMRVGLRGTPWDLWGDHEQLAIGALEHAAAGDVDIDLGATATRLHTGLVIADYEAGYRWGPRPGQD